MITLTLTSKLVSQKNAILFSKDLEKTLKEFEAVTQVFSTFCSVCRIAGKIFDSFIVESELQSKIRFEVHSGSMFETEEKLYQELDLLIFQLKWSKLDFKLIRYS